MRSLILACLLTLGTATAAASDTPATKIVIAVGWSDLGDGEGLMYDAKARLQAATTKR